MSFDLYVYDCSPTVVYQTLVMPFYIKKETESVGTYFHIRKVLYGLYIHYILEYCVYIYSF
jgi:hypothetical protein